MGLTGAGAIVGAIFVALIGSLGGAIIWADDWSVMQAIVFVWFLAGILFLVTVLKIGTETLAGGFAVAGANAIDALDNLSFINQRDRLCLIHSHQPPSFSLLKWE